MTTLNEEKGGILGAKRATWRQVNPRELLRRIIDNSPTDDDADWRDTFWSEIENDKDMLRAIADYWLDNNIRSLTAPTNKTTDKMLAAKAVNVAKTNVTQRVVEQVKVAFLAFTMPNDKPLGDCTGSECKQFGGWFAKVGKIVPAKATVREHLSETKLQKLWRETQPA